MLNDPVWSSFVRQQAESVEQLAANSELLTVQLLYDALELPTRFLARFNCTSVLYDADGNMGPAESEFVVGITLFDDHLRSVDPLRVVTWLGPVNIAHPNIRPPVTCVGHVFPGIEVVDLLYSVYEMLGYYNWASHDPLNEDAAAWARNHQHLFPVEKRPLRRRGTGPVSPRQRGEK